MDKEAINALCAKLVHSERVIVDEEHQYAVLPPGFAVADLRALGVLPPVNRIEQRVSFLTTASFCEYVVGYSTGVSSTAIFADEAAASFEAVLDYHQRVDESGLSLDRGENVHVATYRCPLSPQWEAWAKHHGKACSQLDFAKFLEDNYPDITDPGGATMLEVALSLEAHKGAQFKSDLRLDNGQRQFLYEETIRGQARGGTMDIPAVFKIAIPVFIGGERHAVEARLRYRIDGGTLVMWYELVRAAEVLRNAVSEVAAEIRAATAEDAVLYHGKRA